MSDPIETPPRLCAWCGGPVPPSRGTKPRAYCKRGCVQRAYEARKLSGRLVGAYMKGRSEEAEAWRSGAKSRELPAKSRDDAGSTSRDFPKPQVTPPGAGEECPYCRRVVVGLVAHLRQCLEGPGTEGEPDGRPATEPR